MWAFYTRNKTVRQQRVWGLYSSCLHNMYSWWYNFEKSCPALKSVMMQELRREAIATLLTEATTVGQHWVVEQILQMLPSVYGLRFIFWLAIFTLLWDPFYYEIPFIMRSLFFFSLVYKFPAVHPVRVYVYIALLINYSALCVQRECFEILCVETC